MCGDNHWPTLLIRLCTQLRSQLAVLLARVSEVWANLKPFLLPLVRISPHDPILSCLRALLSGGEGEGQICPRHGRFIRADHLYSPDWTWASKDTSAEASTVALGFEMRGAKGSESHTFNSPGRPGRVHAQEE
jgi:hypothetical protein